MVSSNISRVIAAGVGFGFLALMPARALAHCDGLDGPDIGGAVAGFYGKDAGDKLAGLLKQHILIAVDLIAAAKANDQATYKATYQQWTKNSEEIAGFLSQANPSWPKATLASMMETHLATTTKEVVARLNKRWDEDVAAFDEVYTHIVHMADALSDGFIKQFPQKF